MQMSGESLLIILLVGLIAGWLAGQIVQGTGFGIIGDLLIGIVGAFIGSWLLPQLGLHLGAGLISAIINATIGALLLLFVIRLVRGGNCIAVVEFYVVAACVVIIAHEPRISGYIDAALAQAFAYLKPVGHGREESSVGAASASPASSAIVR